MVVATCATEPFFWLRTAIKIVSFFVKENCQVYRYHHKQQRAEIILFRLFNLPTIGILFINFLRFPINFFPKVFCSLTFFVEDFSRSLTYSSSLNYLWEIKPPSKCARSLRTKIMRCPTINNEVLYCLYVDTVKVAWSLVIICPL